MSNKRHVTFYSTVTGSYSGLGMPAISLQEELGSIFLPQNKKYKIENLSINSSPVFYSNPLFELNSFPFRFFLDQNPFSLFSSQVSSPYLFNSASNDSNYTNNDIKDSSFVVNTYNNLYFTLFNPGSTGHIFNIQNIKTRTIFECIPFSNTQSIIKDFIFYSSSNQTLCFCFFPFFTYTNPGAFVEDFNFSYTVNFDLIEE